MLNKKAVVGGNPLNSKSRVSTLTREIDGLVREYVSNGDDRFVTRASKLSREREDLLKPEIMRSGSMKKAG